MQLEKRATQHASIPHFYCEACGKRYTNQAQAVTHLIKGHQMGRRYAEGLLDELKAQHGIQPRLATR